MKVHFPLVPDILIRKDECLLERHFQRRLSRLPVPAKEILVRKTMGSVISYNRIPFAIMPHLELNGKHPDSAPIRFMDMPFFGIFRQMSNVSNLARHLPFSAGYYAAENGSTSNFAGPSSWGTWSKPARERAAPAAETRER